MNGAPGIYSARWAGPDKNFARAFEQIEAALAVNDADLARSYLDLAVDRGIEIPKEMAERVNKAVEYANSTSAHAESFARGLIKIGRAHV